VRCRSNAIAAHTSPNVQLNDRWKLDMDQPQSTAQSMAHTLLAAATATARRLEATKAEES